MLRCAPCNASSVLGIDSAPLEESSQGSVEYSVPRSETPHVLAHLSSRYTQRADLNDKLLLQQLEMLDSNGRTLLMHAVRSGNVAIVETVLARIGILRFGFVPGKTMRCVVVCHEGYC